MYSKMESRGEDLIDFLNLRARGGTTGIFSTRSTTSVLVHLADDRVAHTLQFLELVLELVHFGGLVTVQPSDRGLDGVFDRLLVVRIQLATDVGVVHGVAHVVRVVLDGVLGFDLLLVLLVLSLVLLRVLDHALDVLLAQATLVVGNGNLVLLARALVFGGHVEDTVGVDVEANVNLRDAARRRRNAGELELAQQVVVARTGAFAFEDLDLFVAFAGQNSGLDGRTVGDGFIGVNGLAQILAVEEIGQELLHLGDARGPADEDDLVNLRLVHLRIAKRLFDRVHALAEQIHAELFEASAGDGSVEVDAFEQGIDFDGRLRRGRQGTLGAFASRSETTECLRVARDVLLVLALEFSDEVLQQASVEIFAAQVRVASRRL